MAEQELTSEQRREKLEESLIYDITNPFYLGVFGTNELRANPSYFGELGHKIGEFQHIDLMNGDEADKTRKGLYDQALSEREQLGIVDMPSRPGDYEVSRYASTIIHNAISGLSLGGLEGVLKNISPGVKLEVPNELKDLSGNERELDEDTRKLVGTYKALMAQAVKTGSAFMISDAHRYDGINSQFEKIGKAYEESKTA